ncbi:hypothetical protein HF679_09755 [Enterobacter sp. JUb54]|uniref:hypothetical protein n=1 Tax=Enterobacter sp. JUb54 TaxID=2724468 RepID=UPI00164E5FDA|nr:hypothetical protein [Enterobacter sp. JUb54]QNK09686.1 hypothetical protein HF679_09755 [Enterobacter sp. JUb54]
MSEEVKIKRTLLGKIFLWLLIAFCIWFIYFTLDEGVFLFSEMNNGVSIEMFSTELSIVLVITVVLFILGAAIGFLAWLTRPTADQESRDHFWS